MYALKSYLFKNVVNSFGERRAVRTNLWFTNGQLQNHLAAQFSTALPFLRVSVGICRPQNRCLITMCAKVYETKDHSTASTLGFLY